MNRVADPAFMIDDGRCVDDYAVADLRIGRDHRPSRHDDISAQLGRGGDMTSGMDRIDQIESEIRDFPEILPAGVVITDRDDDGLHFLCLELWQEIQLAQHRKPADFLPRKLGICIKKPDRPVDFSSPENIQHHPSMPAGADEDYIHEINYRTINVVLMSGLRTSYDAGRTGIVEGAGRCD